MAQGTITRFIGDKGFGFIKSEASKDDIFFHVDSFDGGNPQEGQTVEFDLEQSDRGPRAANVRGA